MGFNDAAWGKANTTLASMLTKVKFDDIIQEAQPFINPKSTHAHNKMTGTVEVIEITDDDEQACLVDIDDDDNDYNCKLFYPFVTPLT